MRRYGVQHREILSICWYKSLAIRSLTFPDHVGYVGIPPSGRPMECDWSLADDIFWRERLRVQLQMKGFQPPSSATPYRSPRPNALSRIEAGAWRTETSAPTTSTRSSGQLGITCCVLHVAPCVAQYSSQSPKSQHRKLENTWVCVSFRGLIHASVIPLCEPVPRGKWARTRRGR